MMLLRALAPLSSGFVASNGAVARRAGPLWQRDYFDRLIRDEAHLGRVLRYIRNNPTKAKLRAEEYTLWESERAQALE